MASGLCRVSSSAVQPSALLLLPYPPLPWATMSPAAITVIDGSPGGPVCVGLGVGVGVGESVEDVIDGLGVRVGDGLVPGVPVGLADGLGVRVGDGLGAGAPCTSCRCSSST